MSRKDFFEEYAFGDVYEGTFFAEDFPQAQKKNSLRESKSVEDAKFNEATSKVRFQNEVEVNRDVTNKINSVYALGGDLSSIHQMMSPNFNGRILGI